MQPLAKVFILMVLVLNAALAHGQQAGGWLGQRVILMAGTVLKADKQVEDARKPVPARVDEGVTPPVYRVERVDGPWLRLVAGKEERSEVHWPWLEDEQYVVDNIIKMDWSPRSRTSNPDSRSPVAIPRALDYGKRFTTGEWRQVLSEWRGAVEGLRLTVDALRKGVG